MSICPTSPGRRRGGLILFLLALWLASAGAAHAGEAGWQPGLTRAEVVRLLGPPRSTTQIGGREYLYYADEVRIEVQGGVVTGVNGRVPDALRPPGATPTPAATTTPTPAAPSAEAGIPAVAVPAAAAAPPAASSASAPTTPPQPAGEEDVRAIEQLADPAAALGGAQGQPLLPRLLPALPEDDATDGSALFGGGAAAGVAAVVLAFLAAGFVVKVLVQTVILKVAFHVVGFPGLWRDMIKVAFASNVVGLLLEGLLLLAGEDWRMVYEAARLGAVLNLVLLAALILKFTDVKQLGTAFSIALATVLIPLLALLIAGSFIGSFTHWLGTR